MSYTKRPQNCCSSCGYTWYPRGHEVSTNCPRCGAEKTYNLDAAIQAFQTKVILIVLGSLCIIFIAYYIVSGIISAFTSVFNFVFLKAIPEFLSLFSFQTSLLIIGISLITVLGILLSGRKSKQKSIPYNWRKHLLGIKDWIEQRLSSNQESVSDNNFQERVEKQESYSQALLVRQESTEEVVEQDNINKKAIFFSNDNKIINLFSEKIRDKGYLLVVQPLENLYLEHLLNQEFPIIIIDNQDANLERLEKIQVVRNQGLKKGKRTDFFFIVRYFERDTKSEKIVLEDLSGALFNYAWDLQWRAGEGKDRVISYDQILLAYKKAAEEGSEKAKQWLKEQNVPEIPTNRLWREPYFLRQINN
ncbi:MAG: hypothetical protein PHE58_00690 [Candidatus Omnitrophica bacterium]|nr:hypothetical protein [Candidatus Omnitrophota bacterium]